MSLKDIAIQDMSDIMSDPDLGDSITLQTPDNISATIIGRFVRHNQQFDYAQGVPINALNISAKFSEKTLVTAYPNYPYRNSDKAPKDAGKVNLNGHLVSAADTSGKTLTYQVIETIADETIGVIVLKLTLYSK